VGLINSGVACFYYLRLLSSIYAKPAEDASSVVPAPAISVPAGIGLTLAAAATLMLGILPGHILHLADYASWSLGASHSQAATADAQTSLAPPPAAGEAAQ
jgi:NADH-quinone oxidoreductase subunit N